MKRLIKISLIIAAALIIIAAAVYLARYFYTPANQYESSATAAVPVMMTDDEKIALGFNKRLQLEVISRDAAGKVTSYRFLGLDEEQPLSLELMNDEEKMQKGLATSTKVQILERNSAGKITAYKIIRSDADIITKY